MLYQTEKRDAMRNQAYNRFYKRLRQLARFRKTLLIGLEILRSFGTVLLFLALYIVADYFLALPNEALLFLDVLLILFVTAAFTTRVLRIMLIPKEESAAFLDDVAKNRRRSILSACELEKRLPGPGTDENSFEQYLISKTAEDANKVMSGLTLKDVMPSELLKKSNVRFILIFTVFAVVMFSNFNASKTIVARIFCPLKDIPPYSLYTFDINPSNPEVLYGETLELAARIKGAPLKSQVYFCTRDGGKVRRSACFREGPDCFAQKMEKVTAPVEFCFATGRARSKWNKVKILFQPKVMLAKVVINSPSYSRIPPRSFIAGVEDIKGLKGSDVELTLISNRPLSGGRLTVKPENNTDSLSVNGEKSSPNGVTFHWKLDSTARLEADILDHIGTKSSKPLILKQSILEDLPPSVAVSEPGPFILATPGVKIPFSGTVRDDIGIRKIELVKALSGYHDRIGRIGTPDCNKEENIAFGIDLSRLGVQPGQTLEFYIEAFDMNPELTGVSASDILKVQIISESEYAEYLRNYTKLEKLIASYRELTGEFDKLRKLSAEFKKALEKGGLSEEEKKRFIDELRKSNERAAKLFRQFAEDFPIYDMEKEQKKTFKDILSRIISNDELIAGMDAANEEDLKRRVEKVSDFLAEKQEEMSKIDETVDKFEALSMIMQDTAVFKKLVMEQNAIVRRLNRYEGKQQERSAMLENISEKQKELLDQLQNLMKDINVHAEKLQPEFAQLKEDSLRFIASVKRLMIPDLMKAASENARNQNGPGAYRNALDAYKKMLILADKEKENEKEQDSFRDMMNGKINFPLCDGMKSTASEMLNAINKQVNGKNSGSNGSGGGQFSGGQSGYSESSNSMLNVPVMGPPHSTTGKDDVPGRGSGKGEEGKDGPGIRVIDRNSSEKLSVSGKEKTEGADTLSVDEVPEKYRDAVKKYFGE